MNKAHPKTDERTIHRFRLCRRVGSVQNCLNRLAIRHALCVQLGMAA